MKGNTTVLIIVLCAVALLVGGAWLASSMGLLPKSTPQVEPTPTVIVPTEVPVLENDLTGTTWIWTEIQMSDGTINKPQKTGDTSIVFQNDGTVSVDTDCNTLAGTYTVDGNNLTFTVGLTTRMACPESSTEERVARGLSEVQSYMIKDGELVLMLKFDSGSMIFTSNPYVGTYKSDEIPSATLSDRIVSLWLYSDSKVQMNTDYQNEQPAISETGTWGVNAKGILTVVLRTKNGQELESVQSIQFTQEEDGTLKSFEEEELYGEAGLTLQKLSGTIVM